MIVEARSLNADGVAAFGAWLDSPVSAIPKQMLADSTLAEVHSPEYRLELERRFATTYEMGRYLADEVFCGVSDRFALLNNHGLWAWISLAYMDSLVKKSGQPLAKAHYLNTHRLGYRLIARTAWDLVSLHGDAAKVALGSTRSPWGEMAEQMTSRQEIYANRSFWPVASQLYVTSDGAVKVGATSQRNREARRDPKSKAGLGGVRRLPFAFKQFDRTYNLRVMESTAIAALLPMEYKKWRAAPNP